MSVPVDPESYARYQAWCLLEEQEKARAQVAIAQVQEQDPPVVHPSGSSSSSSNPEPTSTDNIIQPTDQISSDRELEKVEQDTNPVQQTKPSQVIEVDTLVPEEETSAGPKPLSNPVLVATNTDTEKVQGTSSNPSLIPATGIEVTDTTTGEKLPAELPTDSVSKPGTANETEAIVQEGLPGASSSSEDLEAKTVAETKRVQPLVSHKTVVSGSSVSTGVVDTESATDPTSTLPVTGPGSKPIGLRKTDSEGVGASNIEEAEFQEREFKKTVVTTTAIKPRLHPDSKFWVHFDKKKGWRNGRFNDASVPLSNQNIRRLLERYGFPEDYEPPGLQEHHKCDPAKVRRKPSTGSTPAKASSDYASLSSSSGAAAGASSNSSSSSGLGKRKTVPTNHFTYDKKGENKRGRKELEAIEDKISRFDQDIWPCFCTSFAVHHLCQVSEDTPEEIPDEDQCTYCPEVTDFYCNGCTDDSVGRGSKAREIRSASFYCLGCHSKHLAQLGIHLANKLFEENIQK